jgi:hypothetical protein
MAIREPHMSGLPLEVYENIIKHCYRDKAMLAICRLVCRAWNPAGRCHLFRKIDVVVDEEGTRIAQFLSRLRSLDPERNVVPYVCKVVVYYPGWKRGGSVANSLNNVLWILGGDRTTPGYCSIVLGCLGFELGYIRPFLPIWRLTEMEVRLRAGNRDVYQLGTMFASIPNLQSLLLDGIRDFHERGDALLLPQLRTLQIHNCNTKSILSHFATPLMLREVTCNYEDVPLLRRFWPTSMERLTRFEVKIQMHAKNGASSTAEEGG